MAVDLILNTGITRATDGQVSLKTCYIIMDRVVSCAIYTTNKLSYARGGKGIGLVEPRWVLPDLDQIASWGYSPITIQGDLGPRPEVCAFYLIVFTSTRRFDNVL